MWLCHTLYYTLCSMIYYTNAMYFDNLNILQLHSIISLTVRLWRYWTATHFIVNFDIRWRTVGYAVTRGGKIAERLSFPLRMGIYCERRKSTLIRHLTTILKMVFLWELKFCKENKGANTLLTRLLSRRNLTRFD